MDTWYFRMHVRRPTGGTMDTLLHLAAAEHSRRGARARQVVAASPPTITVPSPMTAPRWRRSSHHAS